ncbi:MAG: TonB-dependent receptor [Bacteroidia bacterium]|nr:TonB-dependent receptor [Bacteroidia bacterium]
MKQIALILFFIPFMALAQVQTLRGVIVDKETKFPLENVSVSVYSGTEIINGGYSDESGRYRFDELSIGRYQLVFDLLGYNSVILSNIMVNSGRETILDIEMEENGMKTDEVVIKASKSGDPINEMAIGSSRSFTVDETDRYAGSRGDPSRMASNFAGVQGADDSRNDIVIRGNSPGGLLWRLEGIDIPNPNHFAIPGTAGGPVSILNNKILANSDFYTGAFPSEFGNSTAGAFDLRLRNGNNEQYESSFQFGFMGTEASVEGPLSKSAKSSFLAAYRYSTLAMFGSFGIDVGTSATPYYQDLSFKFNFPLKNNAIFSLWGIGGTSKVAILISDQEKPERNIYGENDRDQYFSSDVGQIGANYSKSLNENTYFKASLGASTQKVDAFHQLVFRHVQADSTFLVDSLVNLLGYKFQQNQYSANFSLIHKIGSRTTLKAGMINNIYGLTFVDSIRQMDTAQSSYYQFYPRWNSSGYLAYLGQLYAQVKYRLTDKLTFNGGIHSQYTTLGNSFSPVEPRMSLRYDLNPKHNFAFSYGLHSQIQSPYLYFYFLRGDKGNTSPHNLDMKVSRSHHWVGTYNFQVGKATNLKTEVYYQYLFNIPVTTYSSSFSLLNAGRGFSRFFPDSLVNNGTGHNYGVEFSLEKFFTKNYYFMVNTSLFQSKYRGSDLVLRNTDFNGNYIVNALFTKQFDFKNKKYALNVGGKITASGGGWYSPVDTALSNYQRELVDVDAEKNTLRFKPYFRTDFRTSFHINAKNVTHILAIDLINVFDTQNILKLTYAPNPITGNNIRYDYQIGRLPIFYYRLDFHIKNKK